MSIKINPDATLVSEIRKQLKANDGYCPCRLNKIPDNKCMCAEFKHMVAECEYGECHCGLYINVPDNT